MRRLPLAVAVLLLLTTGAAAQLSAFAAWESTPEALFLTDIERKAWKSVKSDPDAQAFVIRFRARRGGDAFKAEIDRRVGTANRFFGSEKTEGWKTFRGKLIVLLGIPSTVNTSALIGRKTTTASKPPAEAVTDLGSVPFSPSRTGSLAVRHVRLTTLRFPARNLYAFKGEDYSVVVEVEAASGHEELPQGQDRKKLNRMVKAALEEAVIPGK